MSTVTSLSKLRLEIATRLRTLGGAWNEASVPYDRFGVGLVPDHLPHTRAHCAFAVGTPSSEPTDRQAPDGTWVRTQLRVRFLARAKPPAAAHDAATDAALDLEQQALRCLLERSASWPGARGFSLRMGPMTQTCPPPHDWYLHELAFEAQHRLALAAA